MVSGYITFKHSQCIVSGYITVKQSQCIVSGHIMVRQPVYGFWPHHGQTFSVWFLATSWSDSQCMVSGYITVKHSQCMVSGHISVAHSVYGFKSYHGQTASVWSQSNRASVWYLAISQLNRESVWFLATSWTMSGVHVPDKYIVIKYNNDQWWTDWMKLHYQHKVGFCIVSKKQHDQ